jgi:hypothetical protein
LLSRKDVILSEDKEKGVINLAEQNRQPLEGHGIVSLFLRETTQVMCSLHRSV